jgi:hypothetical protein|tara:strand:+ start:26234 stop:26752 length:519 start_codon:yes stop_codon:yes gene_type:complete
MAGNICIYRLNNTGETEASGSVEKIEFDGSSATPDGKSHITNYKVTMSLVTQENPNPDTNNPNSLQDTGLAIVEYDITGFFNSTSSATAALGIAQFRDWLREPKTLKSGSGNLPFGRFGIRNDSTDQFDLVPTLARGLILEHFDCDEDYEFTGRSLFTAKLRYNGDITALGA